MTTTQLLSQLNRQLMDLRYREEHAIKWANQGEQNKLYALGALAVIQSQIDDITQLVKQIENEGISDASQTSEMLFPSCNGPK